MMFVDMHGTELKVGDYVMPIEGRKLHIISQGVLAEYGGEVMFGQQVEDMAAFSILTAENLANQFEKVDEEEKA